MPSNNSREKMTDGRLEKYRGDTASSALDLSWLDVDPNTIVDLISLTSAMGDAITFGVTTDTGALRLAILSGSVIDKFYWTDVGTAQHELDTFIAGATAFIRSAGSVGEKRILDRLEAIARSVSPRA